MPRIENFNDFLWTAIHQGITYWSTPAEIHETHISGCDCEDPTEPWSCTFEDIEAALNADPEILERVTTGQYDCEDADIIIQIAAFGEQLYG